MNLAVYARDAMPEGGKLIIESEKALLDEAFSHLRIGIPPGRYSVELIEKSFTQNDPFDKASLSTG